MQGQCVDAHDILNEATRLAATCLFVLPQHAHALQTPVNGMRVLDTTRLFVKTN